MKRLLLLLVIMSFAPASHAICNVEKVAGIYGFTLKGNLPHQGQGFGVFSMTGSLVLRPDGTVQVNYNWSFGGGTLRAFAAGEWSVRDNCTIQFNWRENDGGFFIVGDGVAIENGNRILITAVRGFGVDPSFHTLEGEAGRRNKVENQRL